jgi:hypothetical protein
MQSDRLSWLHVDDVSSFLIELYWEYLTGKLFDEEGFAEWFFNEAGPGFS